MALFFFISIFILSIIFYFVKYCINEETGSLCELFIHMRYMWYRNVSEQEFYLTNRKFRNRNFFQTHPLDLQLNLNKQHTTVHLASYRGALFSTTEVTRTTEQCSHVQATVSISSM